MDFAGRWRDYEAAGRKPITPFVPGPESTHRRDRGVRCAAVGFTT